MALTYQGFNYVHYGIGGCVLLKILIQFCDELGKALALLAKQVEAALLIAAKGNENKRFILCGL